MNFFDMILYQPLFNALIWLYQNIPGHDFGIAVIVLTVLIRLALYPLFAESTRIQKVQVQIQPKMKEIQEKYKNDKEKQAMLIMELWKEHKINPLSSILFILVQIPILWALYEVFRDGFKSDSLSYLYGFVPNPGTIDPSFLGMIDLSLANPYIAVIAGALQYFQTKMMMPKTQAVDRSKEDAQARMMRNMQTQMAYILPAITVVFLWGLPSALGLYWITGSVFSIAQQYYILNKK